MHAFQQVRTARFTFQLKELSFAAVRQLLNISPDFIEKSRGVFLQNALESLQWHKGYEENTLDDLTVNERLFIEACYLAEISEENDFPMGDGRYSDYLNYEQQYSKDSLEIGNIADDEDVWHISPLTGLMAELIEQRIFALENPERADWLTYAMAAQLYRSDEDRPDPKADPLEYGNWLDNRALEMASLPESAYSLLLIAYFNAYKQLTHLFEYDFDNEGLIILSKEGEHSPARFRPTSAISTFTQDLLGQSARSSA